jgi:serine protease Do
VIARRALLASAGAAMWITTAARADLPEVVTRMRASVLPVGTFSATDSPRFGFRGTGFVVGDGTLVATNAHVLPEGADLPSGPRMAVLPAVAQRSGEVRLARVAAVDRVHDLALLRIDGAPLAPLALAEDGAVREGQAIGLMGFPIGGALGFTPVTHRGIVAAVTMMAQQAATAQQLDARAASRLRAGNFEVLQLDATAYPGNSGGPVFDAAGGAVIGVVNMVLVKGSRESALSQPTGISYAIPVRHLLALLADTGPPGPPAQTR